jgi:MarR family transcriptional regulator for hemolysin
MVDVKITSQSEQFRFGTLVHDVSRLRRTVVDHALKPLGITRSQWWVLSSLSRHEGEATMQTELARVLDIGKVALGGLLDRLEVSGYILRRTDPGDRRAKLIEITPAGKSLLDVMFERAALLNQEMMGGMTEEEIQLTENFLERMKTRLIELNSQTKQNGES